MPWRPTLGTPLDVLGKLDRLIPLDPGGIRREGATLDRRRFDQVVAARKPCED